jgi:hypothetical protein
MRHPSSSALLVVALFALTAASAQRATAWTPAAAQDRLAPGSPHETNIVVGELPPTSFALRSIDDEAFDLAAADRPLLLLFFRGTW